LANWWIQNTNFDGGCHAPTHKHILADVLFLHLDAKKSLSLTMGLVTTKAMYYSIVLGEVSTSTAGMATGASEMQSIWKLKQQVKALKKKVPSTSKHEGGKAGGEDNKNYIPPAVLDVICKEGGKMLNE